MKLPKEAIDQFVTDLQAERSRLAEAQAHEDVKAQAREVAAAELALRAGAVPRMPTQDSPSSARKNVAKTAGVLDRERFADKIFGYLARPFLTVPWERFAREARNLGLEELSNCLYWLGKTRGTGDEPEWKISTALAARAARGAPEIDVVCNSLSEARRELRDRARVRAKISVFALALDSQGWILTDARRSNIYLERTLDTATLIARLFQRAKPTVDLVVRRDAIYGAIGVITHISSDVGFD